MDVLNVVNVLGYPRILISPICFGNYFFICLANTVTSLISLRFPFCELQLVDKETATLVQYKHNGSTKDITFYFYILLYANLRSL